MLSWVTWALKETHTKKMEAAASANHLSESQREKARVKATQLRRVRQTASQDRGQTDRRGGRRQQSGFLRDPKDTLLPVQTKLLLFPITSGRIIRQG